MEALTLSYEQQRSFLELQAALSTLKDDRGKTFAVDNDIIDIVLLMGKQTNKQFELKSIHPNSNKFKLIDVDITLVLDVIKMKGKVYDFSKGFTIFITKKDVNERDIKGDENKMKQFLKYIGYKQIGDTKINRSTLIRRMLASIGEPISQVISMPNSSEDEKYRRDTSDYKQGAVEEEEEEEERDYETDKQLEASGLSKGLRPWLENQGLHPFRKVNPINLIERLELLILETKTGHEGLYDEMLDISKQHLSINNINQEHLDNFVFNYGK